MSDNEKKYVKIPLSTAIFLIIIIILVIALIILGIYTYGLQNNINSSTSSENQDSDQSSDYLLTVENVASNGENLSRANSSSDSSTITTVTNSTSDSTTSKSLDINSDQIKKLYSYVLNYDKLSITNSLDIPSSFYKESKVTFNNLSNTEKVLTILQSYNSSDTKTLNYEKDVKNKINLPNDLKNTLDFNSSMGNNDVILYENVNERAQKIFGTNNNISWNLINNGLGDVYVYQNNNYYLCNYQAGGLGLTNRAYSKIIKAEQSGNNIYIYDNFIWYDEYDSLVNGDSYDYLYKSAGKTSLIAKEKSTSSDNIDGNALIAKYKDKLYTYKHTFQKASDGSYYWVSTEPVK